MENFLIFKGFFLFFYFSNTVLASKDCEKVFKSSLRSAQVVSAFTADKFHNLPKFRDIIEETQLERHWSSRSPNPPSLFPFLPENVSFISHRLRESQGFHLVKFPATGSAVIVRAQYESQGQSLETNVSFSKEGLIDNLEAQKKWLIGPSLSAAILFLHGGGTKSTGGHVAEAIINHFQKYNIAVISPDLPWHGEGPRDFMGTLDQEMLALGDFSKQYIHPDVPVFVWGHSWGGTFAHRIMQMTGERESGFFHNNLKGLIITSPAIDPAPGQSLHKKKQAYFQRKQSALNSLDRVAPNDINIFQEMVLDGKTSPVGQFFSSLTIAQLEDKIPDNKGKDFLPALMIVGQGDPMVYVGFEDLFHQYYDSLENLEAHYLKNLPLIMSNDIKKEQRVGHLLSDYLGYEGKYPINFELAFNFIKKQHSSDLKALKQSKNTPLFDMLNILQLWANDLSFREWTKQTYTIKSIKTEYYRNIAKKFQEKINSLEEDFYEFSPASHLSRVLEKALEKAILFKASESGETIPQNFQDKLKTDFSNFKEQLKLVQKHFSNSSFIHDILKAETWAEAQNHISKFFTQISVQKGKKYRKIFTKDIIKSSDENPEFKSLLEKYPYLSVKDIKTIKTYLEEVKSLRDQIKEMYIPSIDDFSFYAKDSAAEAYQRIQLIKTNIKQREELDKKNKILIKEISSLGKTFKVNLDKIRNLIKRLKLLIEEAFISYPDILKEDFEKSEKEFSDLYAFTEKMEDKLEEESLKALETGDLSLQTVHNHLVAYRPIIDEFNKRYDTFLQNRKELKQKIIQAIRSDKIFKEEAEDLVKELYEPQGLYAESEKFSQILAQKEAEKQEIFIKKVKLVEKYNELLPYPALSEQSIHVVDYFLNIPKFTKQTLEENSVYLQQIIKDWKSLNSQLLPTLPE
ncbi:MAG: alpha/beta fold hydrolase [Bdellovibrionaceae bacterium]|nr:alpha/beta fold hydrolase [Pseudobdellovibrionaceae bacterium]